MRRLTPLEIKLGRKLPPDTGRLWAYFILLFLLSWPIGWLVDRLLEVLS